MPDLPGFRRDLLHPGRRARRRAGSGRGNVVRLAGGQPRIVHRLQRRAARSPRPLRPAAVAAPGQARLCRRADHRRLCPSQRRGGGRVVRSAQVARARRGDRPRHSAGDRLAAEFPARSRPRLSATWPCRHHSERRRGPAHPPGRTAWFEPERRAVRARRADHRAAPARQPATARRARATPLARQLGRRRRARRGHDGARRLHHRPRPRRRRRGRPGCCRRFAETDSTKQTIADRH